MKASDIITEARGHLHDVRGPAFRYSEEDLLSYLNQWQAMVLRVRPDVFIEQDFAITPITAATTLIPDDQFRESAVYYVVGSAMLREDEFSDDGRAVSLLNKAASQMISSFA